MEEKEILELTDKIAKQTRILGEKILEVTQDKNKVEEEIKNNSDMIKITELIAQIDKAKNSFSNSEVMNITAKIIGQMYEGV